MNEPLVSICIPAYNSEKTIGRTLDSLLAQTYKNLEIIVVDNRSEDTTANIARAYQDNRIRVYSNYKHFPSAEYNWNRCFQYVNGMYAGIFHADDVYLPDMIARQVSAFQEHPYIGGVFTQGNIVDENDIIVGNLELPEGVKGNTPYSYQQIVPLILKHSDFLRTSSALIRTDIYKQTEPFRYEKYKTASDLDMWLRVAEKAPILILDELLMNYRISTAQWSNRLNKLRTREADYFSVMEDHLSHYKYELPKDAIYSYELLRLGDNLVRLKNLFLTTRWLQCGKICLTHPKKMMEMLRLLFYFKRFNA